MKFLIDAQLPSRIAQWLKQHEHDALHTLDLPHGNRTADNELVEFAVREDRILVTKDSDFVQTFLVTGQPSLLFIATGNIANSELEHLLRQNLKAIERAFTAFSICGNFADRLDYSPIGNSQGQTIICQGLLSTIDSLR